MDHTSDTFNLFKLNEFLGRRVLLFPFYLIKERNAERFTNSYKIESHDMNLGVLTVRSMLTGTQWCLKLRDS